LLLVAYIVFFQNSPKLPLVRVNGEFLFFTFTTRAQSQSQGSKSELCVIFGADHRKFPAGEKKYGEFCLAKNAVMIAGGLYY